MRPRTKSIAKGVGSGIFVLIKSHPAQRPHRTCHLDMTNLNGRREVQTCVNNALLPLRHLFEPDLEETPSALLTGWSQRMRQSMTSGRLMPFPTLDLKLYPHVAALEFRLPVGLRPNIRP